MSKTAPKTLTAAQRAYEQKRADKAGMSLEKWLQSKERKQAAAAPPPPKPAVPKKPNLFSRLLERAQQPLGGKPPGSK